jgi:hypothetical protein
MKIVGFVLLFALAGVGIFALGLFGIARFENPVSTFDSYAELEAAGLIERGWVPAYVPRSATDIKESHDIDTNEGWMSFQFKSGDTAMADQGCQLLHRTDRGRKYLCPPFDTQTAILVLRVDGIGFAALHADEI